MKIAEAEKDAKLLWKDKKRIFGMPISFTTYGIYEKENEWTKLFVQTGWLDTKVEELHIYRIDDISLNQTLGDKMYGVGSIKIYCQDASNNEVTLKCIKEPYKVRALLNDLIERERTKRKTVFGEFQ